MRIIAIDGRKMDTREHAHDLLARALAFPAYYGRNLDALHDLLGEVSDTTRILLFAPDAMERALGGYGVALLRVLRDSARQNPSLRLYTGRIPQSCKHCNHTDSK